jgi:3-hydroxyisobutyrate dehydrogenase
MKAVNQAIVGGTCLAVAEGVVRGRMIANEYPLGFRLALHLKDVGIALEPGRDVGASLPVTALASRIEAGLVAQGHGDEDMSALARAIRSWSGI